jgi:hypothetical protein
MEDPAALTGRADRALGERPGQAVVERPRSGRRHLSTSRYHGHDEDENCR